MPRIIDAEDFIISHTKAREERRTDIFMSWIDKSPSITDYYAIDRTLSTYEYGTGEIDSLIGENSPIKRNLIKSLPLYGIPQFSAESEFDEEIGLNTKLNGECIVLANTIIPIEGDAFIIKGLTLNAIMIVNEVREVSALAKSHYLVQFHAVGLHRLEVLLKQVVGNYTAIYDNIGTEDSVVYRDDKYNDIKKLKVIYRNLHDMYINEFHDRYMSTMKLRFTEYTVIDKYLLLYLTRNSIMVFDSIMESSFSIENNDLYDKDDMLDYSQTLFSGIEELDVANVVHENELFLKLEKSPFNLFNHGTSDNVYVVDKYLAENNPMNIQLDYDFKSIHRYITTQINDNTFINDRIIILNYLSKFVNKEEFVIDTSINYVYELYKTDKYTSMDRYYLIPLFMNILKFIIKSMSVSSITKGVIRNV